MRDSNRRAARDRYERIVPAVRQSHADERDTNPDPCPHSKFGKHRFSRERKNANGRLICDFCTQERIG